MPFVGRVSASLTPLSLFLLWAPAAFADAGGGSSSYGGGGSSGSGSSGGGGDTGSSGGGYTIDDPVDIAFLAIFFLIFAFVAFVFIALIVRETRARKRRRERARRVELAAAEASEDDAHFSPEAVRTAAETLFREAQAAWDARDRAKLAKLLAPDLLVEWERRLDDFARKGWHNRVEVLGGVQMEYVGLTNREDDVEDRAVVRIEATLLDYVEDQAGRRIRRNNQSDNFRSLVRAYWTLGIRDGHWKLLSIEQLAEGDYHLDEAIVASPWSDTERLRDESLVEGAVGDRVAEGFTIADVADLDFDGDARAAALDLSLADGRFSPDVLEVTARRAVEAWAEAVDGDDSALEGLANPAAVDALLYSGDPNRRTRLVVRGPQVKRVRIVALDAGAQPPTMTVALEVTGRRYVEDRDTAAVICGSQSSSTAFTEHWTLALSGPEERPWQITDAATAGTTASPMPSR